MAETTVQEQANAQTVEDASKKKAAPKRKSPSRKGRDVKIVSSKRKTSVARAVVAKGTGIVRINSMRLESFEPETLRHIIEEPLYVSDAIKQISKSVDISVNVNGGGASSQAQAVRSAIAKGIAEFSGSQEVKRFYMAYDRKLIVDDPRRVEPKKFKGPKARARFQKSYR
ncbi:MAG: 30S ribosomal protein S9 [Candidatus Micrarchaeota archaeon]|nr:30S ribosomal protein S9 [Candidatus Micrarchaeota archaeon]